MRKLCGALLALWAVLLPVHPSAAPAGAAEYQFDDVYGPSGKGVQWMAVTTDSNTAGAPAVRNVNTVPIAAPMDTQADLPSGRGPVYLTNGGVTHEPIDTLFLVLPGNPDAAATGGTLWVSFDSSPAGPNTQDVTVDSDSYNVVKTPYGTNGTDQLYKLDFTKRRGSGAYESVRGNFIFHQNPNDAPSQTLEIPFVIANVYNGTAEREPLRFRSDIRDTGNSSSGNIVAHDRFTWNVTGDKSVGANTDWVFVPLQQLPQDSNSVSYRINTEVANYTGIRYTLQRYDGRASYYSVPPAYWAFDIPWTGTATGDVLRRFYLDELSHIAPGLVTAYSQSFNVVSGVKEVMHLYPVDPAGGFQTLTIEHRSVFGLDLGTFSDSALSPAGYVVTGFRFLPSDTGFLDKVGEAFNVSNVRMPEQTDGVMSGAVNYADIGGGEVIASVGVSAGVPSRLRSGGKGLLPLHVTFNLRSSNQLVSPRWNDLRDLWRNDGNIRNAFANAFTIYLQDSSGNNLDLIKDSLGNDYTETVKVFLDESRGVITVHFIAMVLDGPRSSVRLVKDETTTTDNTHIVVMDGNDNGKWEMKFFVAPAGNVKTDSGAGGGGGGCGVGLGVSAFLACVFAILRWRREE